MGMRLLDVSNGLFLALLLIAALKIWVRKRTLRLVASPFEYLLMLIVLSVPLVPKELTIHLHLLVVAAKSVILFVGFKLVLMRKVEHNRKILLAVVGSCLIVVLRDLLEL